jgi:hypothetical protein
MAAYAPKNLKKQQDGSPAMIVAVGDSAPAKLQIFAEARREIAEAQTTEQVKHILAVAEGAHAEARSRPQACLMRRRPAAPMHVRK